MLRAFDRILPLALLAALLAPRVAVAQAVRGQVADEPAETTDTPSADPDAGEALPNVVVQPLFTDAQTPVASGRGVVLTAGDLYQRVEDAPEPVQRAWAGNPALVNELIDRMVADQLLANEARRRGLERDPLVRAAVERALVARLRASVIIPQAGDGSRVTPDEIRAFYDSHAQRFHIPERRRALVVFLTDRRDAERVLRDARARRRGRATNDFRELARAHNTDPELLRNDGEVLDVTAAQATGIDPALRDAIFALHAPGDVADELIHGAWRGVRGYFVVKYTSHRVAIDRTLAESSDWIRQRLVLDHRVAAERTLVDHLAAEARVVRTSAERVVRITLDDAGAP